MKSPDFDGVSQLGLVDQPKSMVTLKYSQFSNILDITTDPLRAISKKYCIDIANLKYERKERIITYQYDDYIMSKFNALLEEESVFILEFTPENNYSNVFASELYAFIVGSIQAHDDNYLMIIVGWFTTDNKFFLITRQFEFTLRYTLQYHQEVNYYFDEQYIAAAIKSLVKTFCLLEKNSIAFPKMSSNDFMLNSSQKIKLVNFHDILVFLNPTEERYKIFVKVIQKSIKSLGIVIYEMVTHVILDSKEIKNEEVLTAALGAVQTKWVRSILLNMLNRDKRLRFKSFSDFQEFQ